MRPGRVTVLSSFPGLALLGVLQAAPPPIQEAGQGVGSVLVRVGTDGRPQLLPPRASASPLSASRPAERTRTRVVATAPAPAVTKPRPTPLAPRAVDSYPFADDTSAGADPWGFTMRQCVSYVAWRLSEAGRPLDNARDRWGSALDWDEAASRLGFAVTSAPTVGAVAHWEADERGAYWSAGSVRSDGWFAAGSAGHVAWVTRLFTDGSVQVAQYNGTVDRGFSTMRVRAPRYLQL